MAWTKVAAAEEVFRSDEAGVESTVTVATATGAVTLKIGAFGPTQGPVSFGDKAKVKAAFEEIGALL